MVTVLFLINYTRGYAVTLLLGDVAATRCWRIPVYRYVRMAVPHQASARHCEEVHAPMEMDLNGESSTCMRARGPFGAYG